MTILPLAWDLSLFPSAMLTGLLAGVVAGLFGVGGGILIVPALLFLFHLHDLPADLLMQMAVGTSLATIVVTNTLATWSQHRRSSVHWPVVARYAPGVLLGAWLGSQVAVQMAGELLQFLFGIFEVLIGGQMILAGSQDHAVGGEVRMRGWVPSAIGCGIGAVSALFGIGGGTLSVPAMTLFTRLPIRMAVGSSSAVGIFLAAFGAFGFITAGWGEPRLPPGAWGYVLPEAFFGIVAGTVLTTSYGVKLAHRLPSYLLKKGFGVFLLLVGIKLMVGALTIFFPSA